MESPIQERLIDPKVSEGSQEAADLRVANLLLELKSAQTERLLASTEVSRIATERNEARREAKQNEELLASAAEREKDLERKLAAERAVRKQMECSISWRVTKPLRAFSRKIRTKRS